MRARDIMTKAVVSVLPTTAGHGGGRHPVLPGVHGAARGRMRPVS